MYIILKLTFRFLVDDTRRALITSVALSISGGCRGKRKWNYSLYFLDACKCGSPCIHTPAHTLLSPVHTFEHSARQPSLTRSLPLSLSSPSISIYVYMCYTTHVCVRAAAALTAFPDSYSLLVLRINLLSCRVSFVYYRRRCVHCPAKSRYLRALKYGCSPVDPDRPFLRSGFYKPPRSTATDAFGRSPARRARLMYYARSPWLPVPPIRTQLQVTWIFAFNRTVDR